MVRLFLDGQVFLLGRSSPDGVRPLPDGQVLLFGSVFAG